MIEQANIIHNLLMDDLKRSKKIKNKLKLINAIAHWNTSIHTGRFTSVELESEIKKCANSIQKMEFKTNYKTNSILHIATSLDETGGHTKLFENYLINLSEFENDLFLTKHDTIPLRIKENKNLHKIFSQDKNNDTISIIQHLASIGRNYDFIFLHINQFDFIPIIANELNKFRKVIFINHSDHTFWLGSSITDICVNFRPFGNNLTLKRRNIKRTLILPLPIKFQINPFKNQSDTFNKKSTHTIFLTVSSKYKLIPSQQHNFFKTIYTILDLNPNFQYILIGVSEEDLKTTFNIKKHERLFLTGVIEDPSIYYQIADVYLEGFPFNSLTALYESILHDTYPVLMYSPENPNVNLETELAFEGILYHSENEEEYINHIINILDNPSERTNKINELKKRILFFNNGEYWEENLNKIFKNKIDDTETGFIEYKLDENDIKLHDFFMSTKKKQNIISTVLGNDIFNYLSFINKIKLYLLSINYLNKNNQLIDFILFNFKIIYRFFKAK